jgi:hypothetical protein
MESSKMAEEQQFEVVDRRRVRSEAEGSALDAEAAAPEAAAEEPSASAAAEAGESSQASEAAAATEAAEADEVAAASEADEADEDEEEFSEQFAGIPGMNMSVTSILVTTHGLLGERAWSALGLVPDPLTGKIEKNLPEARRAIDALADVVKHLDREATDSERREMQGNLSNLRINYVRLSG